MIENSECYRKIPCATEQGIAFARTGNFAQQNREWIGSISVEALRTRKSGPCSISSGRLSMPIGKTSKHSGNRRPADVSDGARRAGAVPGRPLASIGLHSHPDQGSYARHLRVALLRRRCRRIVNHNFRRADLDVRRPGVILRRRALAPTPHHQTSSYKARDRD